MSILIKGAKMPKRCLDCGIELCKLWRNMRIEEIEATRHPDCPLVEIPPYSKLIDASMVYQELLPYSNSFRKSVLKIIENIPTVIESEEEEHE